MSVCVDFVHQAELKYSMAMKAGDASSCMEILELFDAAIRANPSSPVLYLNKASFLLQARFDLYWSGLCRRFYCGVFYFSHFSGAFRIYFYIHVWLCCVSSYYASSYLLHACVRIIPLSFSLPSSLPPSLPACLFVCLSVSPSLSLFLLLSPCLCCSALSYLEHR